ncbi:MAG: sporulation protein YabP [Clostridiales bacterium]|jgi:sporulation protein YabP|nr:sporulation protein YabP [Clostridiales bacterium]
MPDEKKSASRHAITIDRRNSVSVTGVLDVISFDEETIIAETEMGVLIIRGVNLHVNRLHLDSGELSVDGEIVSINYEDNSSGFGKGKMSFISRLFK